MATTDGQTAETRPASAEQAQESTGLEALIDMSMEGDREKGEAHPESQPVAEVAGKTEADSATDTDRDALEKAKHTLRRDNLPDDVIDAIEPSRVLEIADRAKKRQDDQKTRENQYRQYQEFYKRHQEEQQPKPDDKQADEEPVAESGKPDLSQALAKIGEVDEEIGKEVGNISQQISDRVETVAETLAYHVNDLIDDIKSIKEQIGQMATDKQYDRFDNICDQMASNGSPLLKDKTIRQNVRDKVKSMSALDLYKLDDGTLDLDNLVRDASAIVQGREKPSHVQDRLTRRYQQEATGQPTSGVEEIDLPATPMTERDVDIATAKMVRENVPMEEIERRRDRMLAGVIDGG